MSAAAPVPFVRANTAAACGRDARPHRGDRDRPCGRRAAVLEHRRGHPLQPQPGRAAGHGARHPHDAKRRFQSALLPVAHAHDVPEPDRELFHVPRGGHSRLVEAHGLHAAGRAVPGGPPVHRPARHRHGRPGLCDWTTLGHRRGAGRRGAPRRGSHSRPRVALRTDRRSDRLLHHADDSALAPRSRTADQAPAGMGRAVGRARGVV